MTNRDFLKDQGIYLTPAERAAGEASAREAEEILKEEMLAQQHPKADGTGYEPSSIETARAFAQATRANPNTSAQARQRAYRGNMLKKLKKAFANYKPFTPAYAADFIGVREEELSEYLYAECKLENSRITRMGAEFFINSPFGG